MSRNTFRTELARVAHLNGIYISAKADAITNLVMAAEGDADCHNIFKAEISNTYLVVTDAASYCLRTTMFGAKLDWVVRHAELTSEAFHRRGMSMGYVVDELVLPLNGPPRGFQMGFSDRRNAAAQQIAEHNCEIAARQINDARRPVAPSPTMAGPGGLTFDPQGPEKAGEAARAAHRAGEFVKAFQFYVIAIDRLHDFYVFERFRNRSPSPGDAWMVEGLTAALDLARSRSASADDVREGVRTATHRLRTIATAVESAGANAVLYRNALARLAECAPDVDVSDIFWS